MAHLTSQEKSVTLGVCLVIFLGALINIGLHKDLRLFDWLHTAQKGSLSGAIDINRAGVENLLKVPGIGPKTAQFILDYRQRHGAFISFEPLREARGMTPQRYERIIQYLKI